MSGFENYEKELADLDHEILHYATLCGVDIADHAAIRACIDQPHEDWAHDKARETLRGLLILRVKVEYTLSLHDALPIDRKSVV